MYIKLKTNISKHKFYKFILEKEIDMKDRIIKGTVTLIILIVLTAVAVVAYFMIAEIETKVIPNENTYTCNIEQKKFMNRNVFILTPENVEKY